MRIVLIGTAFPLRGGIAHYTALLYKHLSLRGHNVRVLAFRRQYPALLFPGKTQEDEGKELIPVDSTPILDSIGPVSWVRSFFWLKHVRPDILVFKYWMPFFAPCYAVIAGLSRWLLGIRCYYLCDNIIPHEKKPGDGFLTRLGLAFINGFIVQSASVRRDLLMLKPDARYIETPHPVYDIFPEAISKASAKKALDLREERVILYFGYIRAYKGLDNLIRAMPGILKRMRVRLLVCGEFYEGRDDTYRLIETLGIEEVVTVFDRFIPNEDVNRYFCAADLVVLPYVSATQSGIVQIAYHYNKPVVVTNVGGLPEVVRHGETGYVTPPENVDALAEAVIRYYDESREMEFSKAIVEEKKKYSWDRMVDAVETITQE